MKSVKKSLVQFQNIAVTFNDKTILENISGSVIEKNKIGLIGINGSGKSTLLKIIAGITEPEDGQISKLSSVEYLKQIDLDLYRKKTPLYQYIESNIDNWWDVLSTFEEIFKSKLSETQSLNSLSGGEIIKLNICIAITKKPQLLLLDEPTNHMDLRSINYLSEFLQKANFSFIIVSHNIDFLNNTVNTIWEIDKGKLKIYGGNYNFYKAEKEKMIQSQLNKVEAIQKKIKREKASLSAVNIGYQKSSAKLERMARTHDRSMPKIVRKAKMDGLQTGYGDIKSQKKKNLKNDIEELETLKIKPRRTIHTKLVATPHKGLLLRIDNAQLTINKDLILIRDINFSIYHKDRVAILGDNGSGKTLLVKQLEYDKEQSLLSNTTFGKEYKTIFVDQKYEIINPNISLVENILKYNNKLNYEDIRKLLGDFTFKDEIEINKKANYLSGGEIARLAFAIATSATADLLILDEPTNNLDIETVEIIANAISEYPGTLIAISHDIAFLSQIKIKKYYEIKNKCLSFKDISNE